MAKSVNIKIKYVALILCFTIVVSVTGGTICLWLDNCESNAFFGVFPSYNFMPARKINISRTSLPKAEVWMSQDDTCAFKNRQEALTEDVFIVCGRQFAPLFVIGQAAINSKNVFKNDFFVLRI